MLSTAIGGRRASLDTSARRQDPARQRVRAKDDSEGSIVPSRGDKVHVLFFMDEEGTVRDDWYAGEVIARQPGCPARSLPVPCSVLPQGLPWG